MAGGATRGRGAGVRTVLAVGRAVCALAMLGCALAAVAVGMVSGAPAPSWVLVALLGAVAAGGGCSVALAVLRP